jgi:hypothetical protein
MSDTLWNKYNLGALTEERRAAYQVNGTVIFWNPIFNGAKNNFSLRNISGDGLYQEGSVTSVPYYTSTPRVITSNEITYMDRLADEGGALSFMGFFSSKSDVACDNTVPPAQGSQDTHVYVRRFYINPTLSGPAVPSIRPSSIGCYDEKNILVSDFTSVSGTRTCTNITAAFAQARSPSASANRVLVAWVVRGPNNYTEVRAKVLSRTLNVYGPEMVIHSGSDIYCPNRVNTGISGNMLRVTAVDGTVDRAGYFMITFFTKVGINNYINNVCIDFESGTPTISSNIRTGVVSPAARYSVLFSKKNRKFYFSMIAENNQSYSSVFSEGANAAMSTNTNVKDVLIRDSDYRFYSFNSEAPSTVNALDETLALKNTVQIPAPIPTHGGMLTSSNQLMLHGDPGITIYNLSSISRSNLDDSLSLAEIINPNGEHSVTSLLD